MRRFLGINIGSHEEKFNSIEFIDLFALILILFVFFLFIFKFSFYIPLIMILLNFKILFLNLFRSLSWIFDKNRFLQLCRVIETEYLLKNLYLNMKILSTISGILLRILLNSDLA